MGKRLAVRLGLPFVDADDEIERAASPTRPRPRRTTPSTARAWRPCRRRCAPSSAASAPTRSRPSIPSSPRPGAWMRPPWPGPGS
ncbi:MAG TPA: hypothetical protein VFM16_06905 [Holophagaceae bacterium]|nr:hypothetical protein [Holophagaceae bacterium]